MAKPNFTPKELETYIENGLISKRKHPTENLWILNYTPKCQHEWIWDNVTRPCRGLIIDTNFNIIARPFEKFFTPDQLGENWVPSSDKTIITRKVDGSLGIMYWIGDTPYITTRGSFTSKMAIKGTEILHSYHLHHKYFDRSSTYLFEIIYPQNRIVVDYGQTEQLVLLAKINTVTGKDLPIHKDEWPDIIPKFSNLSFVQALQANEPNKEGYVCYFSDTGERVKIKNDWYKLTSYALRHITPKRFIGYISKGNLEVFDKYFPTSSTSMWILDKVNTLLTELNTQYQNIHNYCYFTLKGIKLLLDRDYTRKEIAIYIKHTEYPNIIFALLDNKDVSNYIWKEVGKNYKKVENIYYLEGNEI